MKKMLLASLSLLCAGMLNAQADTLPKNWKLKAIYGANATQSSFVNWNAGGRNNVSALAYITASAKYQKDRLKWDNDLGLALGGLQYIGANGGGLQKTDDRMELATNIGYKLKNKVYLSFLGSFRTQFLDGFNYPDESVRVSKFMAPGYLTFSLGIDYTPNDNFSAFLSPVAAKLTFVQDQVLADQGAFGVDAATYDTAGVLITPGKQMRPEFGAYFRLKYNKELAKNINMNSKLELFSNYLKDPQNIDVNAEVLFTFKINSWLSASANFSLIYDHDIRITDAQGNVGPRTQFKSVLGLGVSYTMQNYVEKKK